MRRVFIVLLLVLSACRAAPVTDATPPSGFPSELAEPATSLEPTTKPTASTAPNQSHSASPRPTATTSTAPAFAERASATDPPGDHGANAPGYADIRRLSIESDGTNVRVIVRMNAAIPNPLPSKEQMAIGVDLYRTNDEPESVYQFYASGNDEGWSAFLDTPKGFVKYPGTLQIGGATVVFTVPWSSVGNMRSGFARAFADWDREGTVLNQTGEDHAPDAARLAYR